MGTVTLQACCADEEGYIDMELSSSSSYSSNFLCYSSSSSISSPPQTREFEFQLISVSSSVPPQDKEATTTTTSPADELFYKGKLLPLHLPPRLQMVQKLLRNSEEEEEEEEHNSAIPLVKNSSESESCRVRGIEINPDEYLLEWSSIEISAAAAHDHNNFGKMSSWTKKKLKQIKQYSVLSQKIKASRAYLKSLFIKPAAGCSDKDWLNKCIKRNPFGKYYDNIIDRKEIVEDGGGTTAIQRRSFSGAIQWHSFSTPKSASSCSSSSSSTTSSGSSSFSLSSSNNGGIYDIKLLKRSNSANSEIESSIEGAIAHCKNSLTSC